MHEQDGNNQQPPTNSYDAAHRIVAAVLREPRSSWTAMVDESCGDDEQLHKSVKRLLDEADLEDIDRYSPGDRIGSCTIVKVAGEGRMATVYEAIQDNTKQAVAIKVLKPEAFSSSGRLRFASEGRTLGQLEHPNIARVYEAQPRVSESDPRPFMVMELIGGKTLCEYLQHADLSLKQKLHLFAKICDAVAHAHNKPVIHRDLKPSNIMVDATGEPKVLDFGIARMVNEENEDHALTQTGMLLGTPAYMSPEQCAGQSKNVTIRTDVYSLGVIAFEMLSGRSPHDLDDKDIIGAMRTIREEPPRRLRAVAPDMPRDVETMLAKALESNPVRRYRDADDLACDIRRYLNHIPITARPATRIERSLKWIRRHPAITGTLTALAVGVVGVVIFAVEASIARADAQRRAITAEETIYFIRELLLQADPYQSAGRPPTILEVTQRAEFSVEKNLIGEPAVQASIQDMLGRIFFRWGMPAKAKRQWELALKHAREADPPNVEAEIAALQQLPIARMRLAMHQDVPAEEREATMEAAITDLQNVLERAIDEFGTDHRSTHAVQNTLYSVLHRLGRYAEAERGFRDLAAAMRRIEQVHEQEVLIVEAWLGQALYAQKKYDEAMDVYQGVLNGTKTPDSESLELWLAARHAVVQIKKSQGKWDEARTELKQLLFEAQEVIVSPDHPVLKRLEREYQESTGDSR